ncbi:hypothetical protein AMJ82_04180 [candidate division TA06 bacterium SM23_40]|uniref:Uncharacterized protein n=1 Tax=candidate division TA06 bacterium SM23_40 TaxID=1703774 RepID=A0A0S8GB45_UNCT6|nr:MAG: hypothetical protein AMJ82_04180 [candidate division TA06 bacterium SM23_40]
MCCVVAYEEEHDVHVDRADAAQCTEPQQPLWYRTVNDKPEWTGGWNRTRTFYAVLSFAGELVKLERVAYRSGSTQMVDDRLVIIEHEDSKRRIDHAELLRGV